VHCEGRDVHLHVGEERQTPENLVQPVIAGDVENADVGVFAHASPDALPLALALQFL
jgi:hypothetical protein